MPSTNSDPNPKAKRSNSRLKLFIDRDVQGTLARQLCFHWMTLAFCLFVFTSVVHIVSNSLSGTAVQWDNYWRQNGKIFIVMAFVTPVFVWDAIKMSHRFTGPIIRLRQGLSQMGEGQQVQKLKFRDGDFWHDIAASFNKARKRLLDAELAAAANGDRPESDAETSTKLAEQREEQETLV